MRRELKKDTDVKFEIDVLKIKKIAFYCRLEMKGTFEV